MAQRVDLSQYFTRRQSDARYSRLIAPPGAPTWGALGASGIVTTYLDQSAWFEVNVIDPDAPPGAEPPTGFYIPTYQFELTYGSVTRMVLLAKTVFPYRLTGLPINTEVTVKAYAIDYLGQRGPASAPLVVTTEADLEPPADPPLDATVVEGKAYLTITDLNDEIDFNHYEVYRGRGASEAAARTNAGATPIATFANTFFQDRAVQDPGNDYWYFVKAVDSSGNKSAGLNTVGPLTLTSTDVNAPTRPTIIGATAQNDGTVLFAFQAVADASNYRIWRKAAGGAWLLLETIGAPNVAPGTTIEYSDTRAINGVTYTYAVAAVSLLGDESGYDEASTATATADDQTKPEWPTSSAWMAANGISFDGQRGSVVVTWLRALSPDVKYYMLWVKTTGGYPPDPLLVEGNTFTIYGLQATRSELAGSLGVQLVAFDGINNSDLVEHLIEFPELDGYWPADAHMPAMPTNQTAEPNADGSATVAWDASTSVDRAGYQIDVQERQGTLGAWKLVATLSDPTAGRKSFDDVGLEPYKFNPVEYRYRVRTLDASGNLSPLNLFESPSFDDGTAWTGLSMIDGGTGHPHVAAVTSASNTYQDVLGVLPGERYTLSAFLKGTGADGVLVIEWRDGPSTVLGQELVSVSSTGSWARCSVTDVAPAGADRARCYVRAATATQVLWDQAQFEQNYEASGFSEGKTLFLKAVDTAGPLNYSPIVATIAGLGFIGLRWHNPTAASFTGPDAGKDVDYINGVFEVWRAPDIAGTPGAFAKLAEVLSANDGAEVGYDDLSPSETQQVTYHYRLKARDRFGNVSTEYLTISTTPGNTQTVVVTSSDLNDVLQVPDPIDGVPAVEAQTDGSIKVTWTPQQDVGGYRVWRRRASGDTTALFLQMLPGESVSTYYDRTAVDDTQYLYGVSVYNMTGGESTLKWSDPITANDTEAPEPPAAISLVGGPGSIRIDWSPVTGATKYVVEWSFDGETYDPVLQHVEVSSPANSFTLFGLTQAAVNLEAFKVRIASVDAASQIGTPRYSAPIGADGLLAYTPGDFNAPNPPTNLVCTTGNDGTILLQWDESDSVDRASYVVEKQETTDPATSPTPSPSWEQLALVAVTPEATSEQYRAVGLEPYPVRHKRYLFRIRTVDQSGQISATGLMPLDSGNPLWLRAADVAGPAAYNAGLMAVGALGAINLTWVNPDASTFTGPDAGRDADYFNCLFEIWRDAGLGFANPEKVAEVSGSNDGKPNGFADLAAEDNTHTKFYYKVRARDRFGNVGAYITGDLGELVEATSLTIADLADGKKPSLPVVPKNLGGGGGTLTGFAVAFVGSNGNVTPATYVFRLVAYDVTNNPFATSSEISIPAPSADGYFDMAWDAATGANYYRVYGGLVAGAENQYFQTADVAIEWGKTGGSYVTPTAGTVPVVPDAIYNPTDNKDGTITITWNEAKTETWDLTDPENPVFIENRKDLAGYNIYRKQKDESNAKFTRVASISAKWGSGVQKWSEAPPAIGATWNYVITAYDTQLEESTVDWVGGPPAVSVRPTDTRKPEPPIQLRAVGGLGRIDLFWLPSPSPGVTRYRVHVDNVTIAANYPYDVVAAADLEVTGTAASIALPFGPSKAEIIGGQIVVGLLNIGFCASVRAIREGSTTMSDECKLDKTYKAGPPVLPTGYLNLDNYLAVDTEPPYPPIGYVTASNPTWYHVPVTVQASKSRDVNRYVIEATQRDFLGGSSGTKDLNGNYLYDQPYNAQWYSCGTVMPGSNGALVSGLVAEGKYRFRVATIDNSNNSSAARAFETVNGVPTAIKENPRGFSDADAAAYISYWWVQSVTYNKNDVVLISHQLRVNGQLQIVTEWYRCLVNGTTGAATRPVDYYTGALHPNWTYAAYAYSGWCTMRAVPPPEKPSAVLITGHTVTEHLDTHSCDITITWNIMEASERPNFGHYYVWFRENSYNTAPREVPGNVFTNSFTFTDLKLTTAENPIHYTFEMYVTNTSNIPSNTSNAWEVTPPTDPNPPGGGSGTGGGSTGGTGGGLPAGPICYVQINPWLDGNTGWDSGNDGMRDPDTMDRYADITVSPDPAWCQANPDAHHFNVYQDSDGALVATLNRDAQGYVESWVQSNLTPTADYQYFTYKIKAKTAADANYSAVGDPGSGDIPPISWTGWQYAEIRGDPSTGTGGGQEQE